MGEIYKVTHTPSFWTCEVEIDTSYVIRRPGYPSTSTYEAMREMILFWSGGKSRLKRNDDDVIKLFLQQLAREIYQISLEYNYNTAGIIDEFKNREGWCKMDGSCGIKIVEIDDAEIDYDEFDVEEVS